MTTYTNVRGLARGLQVLRALNAMEDGRATSQQIADLTGLVNPVDDGEIVVTDAYLAPGYGKLGPGAGSALRRIAVTEGIAVDPVYTAKALAACLDWAGAASPDERALFIHTGGTPALFAYGDAILRET